MKKIFALFILLVLCLRLPFSGWEYEMARVWVIRIGPLILWLFGSSQIWSFGLKKDGAKSFLNTLIFLGSWLIFLWWSLKLGPDPWKSYWGNFLRGDGFFTFFGFSLTTLWLVYFWEKEWLDIFSWLMVIGGVFHIFGEISSCSDIAKLNCGGWMGNSVLIAAFLTIVIPFWGRLYSVSSGAKRLGLVLVGIFLAFGLVITGTWMATVGILLLSVLYLGTNRYLTLTLALIATILLSSLWWHSPDRNSFVAESRQRIWTKGFLAFTHRPFLGWGMANYDYAFESVDWPIPIFHDVVVDKAHNETIEYLVTGGFTSFLFYLISWYLIFKNIWRAKKERNFLLLLAGVYIFVSSVNIIPIGVQLIFWLLLGSDHA